MRAPADVTEVAPGRYEGSVDMAMRGAWPLTIEMQDPETGDEARLQFDLATDRTGLELVSGATPVGQAGVTAASGDQTGATRAGAGGMARFRAGDLEIGVATEPGTAR